MDESTKIKPTKTRALLFKGKNKPDPIIYRFLERRMFG
jgi:hypothetical protein